MCVRPRNCPRRKLTLSTCGHYAFIRILNTRARARARLVRVSYAYVRARVCARVSYIRAAHIREERGEAGGRRRQVARFREIARIHRSSPLENRGIANRWESPPYVHIHPVTYAPPSVLHRGATMYPRDAANLEEKHVITFVLT